MVYTKAMTTLMDNTQKTVYRSHQNMLTHSLNSSSVIGYEKIKETVADILFIKAKILENVRIWRIHATESLTVSRYVPSTKISPIASA